jgi:citrate synthase
LAAFDQDVLARTASGSDDVTDFVRLYGGLKDHHPVVRLCLLFQHLQRSSKFLHGYYSVPRTEHWRLVLDDALTIYSILPHALMRLYNEHERCFPGYDLVHSGGADGPELLDLASLYVLVHCDHEGSNACALACRTASSAHADPYLALTAGWRALAGPIHGLASQTCIEFIDELRRKLGDAPSDTQLAAEVQARIDAGRVIPGFGHAVLRALDPRYELLHSFALRHFPDDPAVRIADGLLRVVPPLLQATGKVASPWPNVDGITGAVMQHYGLTDYRWLTVAFAACMSLGLLAQMVVSRGLGEPILHPKAITPALLRQRLGG